MLQKLLVAPCACVIALSLAAFSAEAQSYPPTKTAGPAVRGSLAGCRRVKVCVQWARPSPGAFTGRCVRYTTKMTCGGKPPIR